ncbi:MAG: phosphatase PAP2 family protein [Candidatus Marinimicrobia bacterium]|nr:phosphatase PAP2 family protein [Candidatus Neomarinimicrobiota bacterium]
MKVKSLAMLLIIIMFISSTSLKGGVSNRIYITEVIPGAATTSFVLPSLAGGAVLSLAVSPFENKNKDYLYAHPFLPDAVSRTGDRYISEYWFIPISLIGVLAEGMKTDRYYEPLRYMVVAHTLNLGLTYGLKWAVRRERPNGMPLSFPSAHTSIAFTTATLLTCLHGSLVGIPMYTMAVLTGLSRINDQMHWPSDVLFGALLGTVTARALYVSEQEEKESSSSIVMLPLIEIRFSSAQWITK